MNKKLFYLLLFLLTLFSLAWRLHQIDLPRQYVFDEDMHAFTALLMASGDARPYEWWHQPFDLKQIQAEFDIDPSLFYRPPAIEWLHPPLAKLLQATSIRSLGNSPLSWRLPSAIFGAGVVSLIFCLTVYLTQSYFWGVSAGVWAALDPFLTVQSQIASADIFVTFFTLAVIGCYIKFKDQRSTIWTLTLGAALGLTLASKWSGLFITPGLLIFDWLQSTKRLEFFKQWSLIFLVAISVYLLSYGQMFVLGKNIFDLLELHRQAWWYQTHTSFTHPSASRPQEWLLGQKPVWYYFNQSGHQLEKVAKPTKIILLLGLVAWVRFVKLTNKSKASNKIVHLPTLLVIVLVSLWLPWIFIKRALFIYHFLPTYTIFILLTVLLVKSLIPQSSKAQKI